MIRSVPGKGNDMGEYAGGEQAQCVWADLSGKLWGDGELSSGAGEGFGAGTLHDLLIP